MLLEKCRLDDFVGAVSVHCFYGVWSTPAADLFLQGNLFEAHQILVQLIGIAATCIWVFFAKLIMYSLIKASIGLRVNTMHQYRGLDLTEHGEVGYPEFNNDAAYKIDHVKDLQKL